MYYTQTKLYFDIIFFLAIGINISWEFSTASSTHAERENLLHLVTLRNLFAMFSAIIQQKHILERFQRATKRGKFSRAAWEFDVVLNSRQQEIVLKQKLNQNYNIASILTQFWPTLDNLKSFQWALYLGIL